MNGIKDIIYERVEKFDKQDNARELGLMKQIGVLDSAALGLVALFANANKLLPIKILLTVATSLIVLSLISTITFFLRDFLFLRGLHKFYIQLGYDTNSMDNIKTQELHDERVRHLKTSAGQVSFWLSVFAFLLAASSIAAVILLIIW